MANLPESKIVTFQHDIRDEFLALCLLLPYAYTDVRAPASTIASATDSTPFVAGGCYASIPAKLSRALFRRSEQVGESGRLDWTLLEGCLATSKMNPPDQDLNELVACLPWHGAYAVNHPKTSNKYPGGLGGLL